MANPSTVGSTDGDYNMALIEVTTAGVTLTLDPNKQYMIQHNGVDASGSTMTDVIQMAVDDGTPAYTSGEKKGLLLQNNTLIIGPNITTLKLDVAANDPTMTIVPLRSDFGRH